MRASEGLIESIPPEDLDEYHAVMKEMLKKYEEKTSPAMACYCAKRDHQQEGAEPGLGLIASSARRTEYMSDKPALTRLHQSRMD